MLMLWNFFILYQIIFSVNRFVSHYWTGSFDQVITKIMISCPSHDSSLGFKVYWLFSIPVKPGVLGDFGFIFKKINLRNLSKNPCCINRTNHLENQTMLFMRDFSNTIWDSLARKQTSSFSELTTIPTSNFYGKGLLSLSIQEVYKN